MNIFLDGYAGFFDVAYSNLGNNAILHVEFYAAISVDASYSLEDFFDQLGRYGMSRLRVHKKKLFEL